MKKFQYNVHGGARQVRSQFVKHIKSASLALPIAAVMGGVAMPLALAKGGVSSPSVVPTTAGPCAYEWITEGALTRYPLTHDAYPGVVSVDMVPNASGAPSLKSVCLDPGWTVESKQVTDGVQLRFNYNGIKAIDFKYVLGKTDIRNL